ncbi:MULTISPECIES: recombinase family protein [Bacillus cereus group]|uniref:recombinase family protein n=1 Tax=Bacillus cereus group TaxID=86661 RepID=UPI0022E97E17|nr:MULTISPECIES: recombinase family protein [unclassified Bacillus cereus group]MDA2662440.1 recombinase family protein [Bacillus cereus group sp. Bc032]MDA2673181.1 recombinase family protein [Bacillus cereus group sp. Bc031]MDA2678609.1 recombinase family protein [Bacillus cereus group sp. Bc029]MDA2684118.1 recombinase family protein [Bacillus cereus group sp. Bc030]MDA2739576.1 recombinase family protein [Bacillus cereus group sp. Bc011]
MNIIKKKTVGIYTRVSTQEQTNGFSMSAQEDALIAYAEKKGYEIYDIYRDGGYSGKDFNRPEVQRMFRDVASDKFDTILTWKVDRLSRNNTDVMNLIDTHLHPNKKSLLISAGDIDSSTTTGYMFISLLSTFARYEREIIVDRVKAGMRKRAESGKNNGGKMLGYNNVNKKLEINEEEARIVKEIFQLRAEGWGYKRITNHLNKKNKKTKMGNPFRIEAVRTILNNEKYIGNSVWRKQQDWSITRRAGKTKGITIKGEHEAIIDIKTWEKVKKINELQTKCYSSNRNFNGDFFLSGVIKCPKCGGSTVMSKVKRRDGNGYHLYYMCQRFHVAGTKSCNSNLIKKDWIEEKVLKIISSFINNKNFIEEVLKKLISNETNSGENLVTDIELFEKELKKQKAKREHLDDKFFDESITVENYNRLVEKVNQSIESLEKKIITLKSELEEKSPLIDVKPNELKKFFNDFNKAFQVATSEQKKTLVRSLIKEIIVTPDRKDIKHISFWFFDDDDLPSNPSRRTVS